MRYTVPMGKRKVKTEAQVINDKPDELNERQELFCQYFVFNDALRRNATRSYAEAYRYNLHELEGVEYKKAESVCAVEGSKLLRKPKIQKRLVQLRNELLTDEVVDSKLAEVIVQEDSYHARMMGITEFNKLRGRITDKVDLTSKGEPITGINYILPNGNFGNSPHAETTPGIPGAR